AALSVQDPRERPLDKSDAADAAHGKFKDETSDFIALLRLWDAYHEQARHLSGSKLRKWCVENFISFVRMREWHDIHNQLRELAGEMELAAQPRTSTRSSRAEARRPRRERQAPDVRDAFARTIPPLRLDAIHRALLAGLLSNIGTKTEQFEYTGARHTRFNIFPGSGLFKSRPQWVMAAELVVTSRLYACTRPCMPP